MGMRTAQLGGGVACLCLVLFVCVNSQSSDNTTYVSCTSPNDCQDPDFPLCLIYWEDTSQETSLVAGKLAPRDRYGVCVQCLSDCDCPTNRYCGNDFVMPKVKSRHPVQDSPGRSRLLEYAADAVAGLRLKSKCFEYGEPVGKACAGKDHLRTFTESFLVEFDGTLQHAAPVTEFGVVKGATDELYCGKIDSFIGTHPPVKGTSYPDRQVTYFLESLYATPGQCLASVYNTTAESDSRPPKLVIPGRCSQELSVQGTVIGDNGFLMKTSEPQWEGQCQRGRCAICAEGQERCSTTNPQICFNGAWQTKRVNDWTIRTFNNNVIAQMTLWLAVFSGLILIVALIGHYSIKTFPKPVPKPGITVMPESRPAPKPNPKMVKQPPLTIPTDSVQIVPSASLKQALSRKAVTRGNRAPPGPRAVNTPKVNRAMV